MSAHITPRNVVQHPRAWTGWPLERVLFALAGSVVLLSALLVAVVGPWWLVLTAFAGVNLLAFVVSGSCVASVVLQRVFGFEKGCAR